MYGRDGIYWSGIFEKGKYVRRLAARIEHWETARPFVIARGVKHGVDVVVAEIHEGAVCGRGEGTAIYYRGDSAEAALAALEAQADAVAAGITRAELREYMPAGAARNALDAALWDLEAKQTGARVWQILGLAQPRPMLTAFTISLGDPAAMAEQAAHAAKRQLLKLKLGGEGDVDRVAAVRRAAPDARLIADANEGWAGLDVERICYQLAAFRLELIEQPLPAGADEALRHIRSPIPLAADETCQDGATLDAVAGKYQFINLKLDKCGGLTEGMAMIHAASARGLKLMTGCMLSTSLGVAPAFLAATQGAYADLDGPLLLASDRPHGLCFADSEVEPPDVALWG